jgi:hypothetical protein
MRIVPNWFINILGGFILILSSATALAQGSNNPPPPTPPPPGTPIDNWIYLLLVIGVLFAFYKFNNKKIIKKTPK